LASRSQSAAIRNHFFTVALSGIVVTSWPAGAAMYGDWFQSDDDTECDLLTVPIHKNDPVVIFQARRDAKAISVSVTGRHLQVGKLIIAVDKRQVITLDLADLFGRSEPIAPLPFELTEAMRDGQTIDVEWSEEDREPLRAQYSINQDGLDAWDACTKRLSETK
jgi:hypothetical protein